MARKYSNTSVETTLTNGIDSSQTSIQINDTGGLPPTFPYSLVLDFETSTVEVVTVTNLSGGTLTVVRGEDGTAAQSHDAGAVVVHGVTARDLSEPQQHIDNTSEVHGLSPGSSLVGTTDTQVLTNKTVDFADNTLTGVASTGTAQTLTNKTISGASNTLADIDGASLVTPFDGSSVDATFNSVTLSGPTPDVNVATELADLRSDVTINTADIATNTADISDLQAGPNPGELVAKAVKVTDSAVVTSEAVVMSVIAPVVENSTYEIRAWLNIRAETGDRTLTRIREDSVAGGQLQVSDQSFDTGTGSVRGRDTTSEAEFTATTTGDKTFVLTIERLLGSGVVVLDADTDHPSFLRVYKQS